MATGLHVLPSGVALAFRITKLFFSIAAASLVATSAEAASCRLCFSAVATHSPENMSLARSVGLRYRSEGKLGIRREATKDGFAYFDPQGKPIRDQNEIARLDGLGIPPGYRDVWISPDPRNHLQATGIDDKGRKQYRYHPDWEAARASRKFDRMRIFGKRLPSLRRRVREDLKRPGLPKEKVLAAVARLLEKSLARIGDETYAEENGTYGLTTLRHEHVKVRGSKITLDFIGKHHIEHHIVVEDRAVATILGKLLEQKGDPLFRFDDGGQTRVVDASDVNRYIEEGTRGDFSAKDFRTWFGSVIALGVAREQGDDLDKRAAKLVAEKLGNTPEVSRESYIHPAVLKALQNPDEIKAILAEYPDDERALLALLRHLRASPGEAP